MWRGAHRRRASAALVLVVLTLVGRDARGEGLSLSVSPNYGLQSTSSTFADGSSTRSESSAFGHTYRLNLDRPFYPNLAFAAGGTFDQQIGWTAVPGPASRGDSINWSGFGRLSFGGDVLGGGASYDRRHEWSASRFGGQSSRSPTLVRESWAGSFRWAPADLPALSLTASRSDSRDLDRKLVDQRSQDVSLSATYSPVKNLETSYVLSLSRPEDRLTGTVTDIVSNSGRVSYAGKYLGKRATYFAAYGFSSSSSMTQAGPGGVVSAQRFPTGGLSAVESVLADPATIALDPNPGLIDGNTRSAAAIDLGFGMGPGDSRPRELGVELALPFPRVNRIFVWVDQPLPSEVAGAFPWSAYRSDDNLHWMPVPITGAVQFGVLDNRFEIPIADTQARYVKVVTRPLPLGVTTDRRFGSILVTEVQAHDVTAVEGGTLSSSSTSGDLMGTTRISLLEGKQLLSFDSTARLGHSGRPITWAYLLVNGLSYGRPLGSKARLGARADRTDADTAGNHLASNRVSGTLALTPLPALSHNLGASTELRQSALGTGTTSAVTLTNRAELLPTLGVSAGGTYGRGRSETGVSNQATTANAGLSLVPHETMGGNVAYAYSWSQSWGGDQPDTSSRGQTLSASLSWNPLSAVYLAGQMTRTWIGRPTTLLNFSAGCSPLRDGELQLAFSYGESYETTTQRRTRTFGPSLRWNIRPGVYIDAAYGESRLYSPVVNSISRTFFVSTYVPVL
jgi:hypothetical protein